MRALLLTALFSLTVACGGSSDPAALISEADTAMGGGDHAGALAKYTAAVAGLDASSPQFERAKMGAVEAMAYVKPAECVAELQTLADGGGVSDRELSKIGGCLADAGNYTQAVDVMDMAMKAFPESDVLKKLKDNVIAKSQAAGDSEALAKLKGLGYL